VTLTFGAATQFLPSAHRLIIVITFAKLFKKISGFKVMEFYGRTDGLTDGGHSYNSLFAKEMFKRLIILL
jgi:hypothetical protein